MKQAVGFLLSMTLALAPSLGTSQELDTIPVEPLQVPEPTSAPSREPPAVLEEIVVTATKREASTRELPGSVTALSGEQMEKLGYQSQEDFLKLVPGVTFANDAVTPNRITVRGIGADLNTSNTTGVFFGDVPFEDPTLPRVTLDPNPFDLARIEVLKGPQGTLFGGSALNGAVRYVPQDPVLGLWEVKGYSQIESVRYGDLGAGYGAVVNAPVGGTLALRIMGFVRNSPGWIDDEQRDLDDVNSAEQRGGRVMALWTPGDRWRVSLTTALQSTQIDDSPITDNREGNLSRSNTPQASPVDTRYDLESVGIQYSFDSFDVLSQTSRTYKRFNAIADASRIANLMDEPPPTVTITNDNESESWMQEIRFTSNDGFDGDWNWLGGLFYRNVLMHEVSDILASDQSLPIPRAVLEALYGFIPGLVGVINEDGQLNTARGTADPVDVTEMAVFGETTFRFFDDLELTLGARVFRTVSDSVVRFAGVLATKPTEPSLTLERVSAGRLVAQGINPKIALKYSFSDEVSAYAAVTRGFRFGGAQVLVGTLTSESPEFYKSDTLWSYEAGLRTEWLDRTVFADVTAFQIDWIDPQLQQADGSGLGSFFDNVGGARARGVEAALQWQTPLPGLMLSVAGSYVRTVTTEPFTTSSGDDVQPGTRWPLAAEWQSATTLSYSWFLPPEWTGSASLLYATISEAPNTLSYRDIVFGYETLDAALSVSNGAWAGRPELSITLANATDERGVLSGSNNPQFANDRNYIRPRTLIARIGLTF